MIDTMHLPSRPEVIIVGAGLAGLAAATVLQRAGRRTLVLEADDRVGGRVRTDLVEGFRLDRGFQVLLTAYPEVARQLDTEALELRTFAPGALVRVNGRFHRFADPLRLPSAAPSSALAPVGTVSDKIRLARLLARLRRSDPRDLLRGDDRSTLESLRSEGLSDTIIERFLRPLLGGIALDPTLSTSKKMAELVLQCLALGKSAVPAKGMQAIPDQLAGDLAPGSIRCSSPVVSVASNSVTTGDGVTIDADAVIVATQGPSAASLLSIPDPGSKAASCVWFAAPIAPIRDRLIVLDGDGVGPAANVAVMTNVAPEYGSSGEALIAAACPGVATASLEGSVRAQLMSWWGSNVEGWRHLRTDSIVHGQPENPPPLHPKRSIKVADHLFVCGDHRDTASIQGALFSGRRCGEAVAVAL